VPSAKLTRGDYQALAEFRHQLRRFLGFSERACRAAGLEPQQHQLLLAVKGMPADTPASVGALADRLQLRHHSAVELIDRMESRRLVRRVRARADRRQVLVKLTARGDAFLARLSVAHRRALGSLAPALRAALHGMLARHRT
jgi:DNA-binding MarR family transcriptional regulator